MSGKGSNIVVLHTWGVESVAAGQQSWGHELGLKRFQEMEGGEFHDGFRLH